MADNNSYKISLGIDINESELSTLKSKISAIETDPIDIRLNIKSVESQINNIRKQIQDIGNIKINIGMGSGSGGNGIRNTVNDMNWAYRQMLDIQKKANSLSLKINGLDNSKNVNELKELSLQFARLRSDYETLRKTFGNQLSTAQWGNLQAEITETETKLSAMDAKVADTKARLAKGIQLKLDDGTFSNDISEINSKFDKLSNKSNETKIRIDSLNRALSDMKIASNNNDIEGLISANERYERSLKDVENQLKINARAEKDAYSAVSLDQAKQKLSLDMTNWLKKNSAAATQFGGKIKELQDRIKACDNTGLNNLKKEFNNVKIQAELAGKTTQSLGDKIKTQFSKYSTYLSIASIFMYATQAMKDMFNQVVEIDSAMTELKKVTDETDASYNQFLSNASSRAKEIGTTISGLVESTADFARLGYNFTDSQGLAEVANIYAVVGDEVEGVEGATESLISTMAAFKSEMGNMNNSDFAMGIIDRFNEIGNKFAITSGGIGEAMKRSASSLDAANNTIDESIALITAANTVVQDPDRVGRLLPTIKVAISVKLQRWTRPSKDFIYSFKIYT